MIYVRGARCLSNLSNRFINVYCPITNPIHSYLHHGAPSTSSAVLLRNSLYFSRLRPPTVVKTNHKMALDIDDLAENIGEF